MSVYLCSLGFKPETGQEQTIPAGGYTVLRFPYGAQENTDPLDMHPRVQPDGRTVTYADPESGLVWPAVGGVGCLELDVIWLDGAYQELRDVFIRDPFGTPDPTAYDHRARTAGENCFTKTHWLAVRRGQPLAAAVAHDAAGPVRVRMAQFKLTIFDDVAGLTRDREKVRPGAADEWPDM